MDNSLKEFSKPFGIWMAENQRSTVEGAGRAMLKRILRDWEGLVKILI